MEPIIIIVVIAALVYPFIRWNHKNCEAPDYGPYALMDDDSDKKIVIKGTLTCTIKEEKEKPSSLDEEKKA